MYIQKVVLHNWMRYQGTHQLELKPTVYGIVAEWLGEPGRSNWAGKSTLIEATPFALLGEHRKRTDDEWITLGTTEGFVEHYLSDGTFIRRERRIGASTKVRVERPRGERYDGKDADRFLLESVLGCSRDEYYLLFFAKQKELAAMVTAKPEEFASTIRSWLQLEPLEALEEESARELARCSEKVRELEASINACIDDLFPEEVVENPIERITKELETITEDEETAHRQVVSWRSKLKDAREKLDSCTEWYRHKAALDSLVGVRAQLREVEASLESRDLLSIESELKILNENKQAIQSKLDVAIANADRAEKVVGGKFDGKCPVMNGEPCKCPTAIGEWGLKHQTSLVGLKEKVVRLKEGVSAATRKVEGCRDRWSSYRQLEAQASTLLKSLKVSEDHQQYMDENPEPESKSTIAEEVARCESSLLECRSTQNELASKKARYQRRLDEITRSLANIGNARRGMDRFNRIRRAAGRQGAQRTIALASMRQIETLGNALLCDAGIPLSFKVRWTVDGKKLTAVCDSCGYTYQGQREKCCPRCKSDRPIQSLDRPGLEMSDRSGAAEDLVGGGLRFGASAWIRRKRAIQWGTVAIDEPFGSLDTDNREGFARYLTTSLMGRYGFEQGFIIAHHDDVMSSMPGRIKVIGTPSGSRIEVE